MVPKCEGIHLYPMGTHVSRSKRSASTLVQQSLFPKKQYDRIPSKKIGRNVRTLSPVSWIIVAQDSVTRSDDAHLRLSRGIQKNKIMPPMLHNDVLNNGKGHASPLTRFIPCPIRLPAQPELISLASRLWLVFHHIHDLIRSGVRHHTACPLQCLIRNFNVQHSGPPYEAT